MIVRAAVCPSPPLLAPGVTGYADLLPELGDACAAAVAWLLAAAPDAVTVIGPAAETASWPPDSILDLSMHAPALNRLADMAAGTAAGAPVPGAPVAGAPLAGLDSSRNAPLAAGPLAALNPSRDAAAAGVGALGAAAALPLSLAIGAQLLNAAGYAGPRVLQSIAESASPDACRDLGRDLAADAPLTALLVMGDGSARRSAAAPGYLDERAEPFDTVVEQAFRDGDLPALAALDPALARDLLAVGRPAWQVLAGALAPTPRSQAPGPAPRAPGPATSGPATAEAATPARPRTRILYSDAPFGVTYLVATLDPTSPK